MTEIVLRSATAADAAVLSAVDVAVWRASYDHILSPVTLDGLAQNPFHDPRFFAAILDRIGLDEWLWVIEADREVRGYCHFGACKAPASRHAGEIERLYLLPAIQGRGIGTRVLAAAARRLIEEGLTPLRTTVFVENAGARRLYERLGARELARQVAFEDQGRPIWECVYGWSNPAPLLAAETTG